MFFVVAFFFFFFFFFGLVVHVSRICFCFSEEPPYDEAAGPPRRARKFASEDRLYTKPSHRSEKHCVDRGSNPEPLAPKAMTIPTTPNVFCRSALVID